MKQIDRSTRRAALTPRNPLVAIALMRQAGPHGGTRKRERQRAERDLRALLRESQNSP